MTYEQALQTLAVLGPEMRTVQVNGATIPRKFSLDHIKALLCELGDPHKTFASVLIAGTNGKGSTAATLASIATAASICTGLFTSPHLVRVNERIKISPVADRKLHDIPDADFGEHLGRVHAAAETLVTRGELPHLPSYFEIVTATAFSFFAASGIQLAVLEVGLGGRLDATNSVEPIISVLTDIGMDHMDYLGHTLREIATEKAGILRQDGILVTLSQHPEANAAIGEAAVRLNVRGVDAARCLPPRQDFAALETRLSKPETDSQMHPPPHSSLTPSYLLSEQNPTPPLSRNRYPLSLEGELLHVDSPLAGQHQQRNIALAIATAIELRSNHGFNIPNAAIEQGIRNTSWPGRLEWIAREGETPVLLDVGHNPAGAWTLRAALSQLPASTPRTLLFSCLRDKPIAELALVLFPLFDSTSGDPDRTRDHIVLAPIDSPRATPLDDLLAAAKAIDVPAQSAPTLSEALALARQLTPKDGIIVATGSVFLVGELRPLLVK